MNFNCFEPCNTPPSPALPPQAGGFLMQQIMAAGRAVLRYERFSLPLSGLPCSPCPPLRLCDVWAEEEGVSVQRCDCRGRGGDTAQVCLPLRCTVCDGCGNHFEARSHIEVPVRLRVCGPDFPRCARTTANAFVRLARGGEFAPGDAPCAWLDGCVEVYITACRAVYGGACPPPCPPELPLYPQPCRRRCP